MQEFNFKVTALAALSVSECSPTRTVLIVQRLLPAMVREEGARLCNERLQQWERKK